MFVLQEDIEIQTHSVRPDLRVVHSLEDLIEQVYVWYDRGSFRIVAGRAKM